MWQLWSPQHTGRLLATKGVFQIFGMPLRFAKPRPQQMREKLWTANHCSGCYFGGAAVFLASDAASFVTGHLPVVDGGILASGVNQQDRIPFFVQGLNIYSSRVYLTCRACGCASAFAQLLSWLDTPETIGSVRWEHRDVPIEALHGYAAEAEGAGLDPTVSCRTLLKAKYIVTDMLWMELHLQPSC